MTDTVSDLMYAAAVTQAERIAVQAMNRSAAYARHVNDALRVIEPDAEVGDE
jgi:hypothetical protein